MLGPLIDLLAVLLAAMLAVLFATRVYKKQKLIDNKNLLILDKREAFRKYFSAAADLHSDLRTVLHRSVKKEEFFLEVQKTIHELFRNQEGLALCAGEAAMDACRAYTTSLIALREHTSHHVFGTPIGPVHARLSGPGEAIHAVLDARESALALARSEVLEQPLIEAKRDLRGLFMRMQSAEELDEIIDDFGKSLSRGEYTQ